MRRYGNLYEEITSTSNLKKAYQKAKKGKGFYKEVKEFEADMDNKIKCLQQSLRDKTFKTSEYIKFNHSDGKKERVIYKLPFYPDRIVHWAIMLRVEKIFLNSFILDTYSAIPGRGVRLGKERIEQFLLDEENTKYCLKLDIKHYYQTINHKILYEKLNRKFKDPDLMWLFKNVIDSIDTASQEDLEFLYGNNNADIETGIPIGNYLSQYFGNFYLSYLDHYCKENLQIKYYSRYMDDIIILSGNKEQLHDYKKFIENFLWEDLKLRLKDNWQIFPVDARGIDFLGYRFFHNYTLLRKAIVRTIIKTSLRAKRKINKHYACSLISLYGWAKSASCYYLIKKYFKPVQYKYDIYTTKQQEKHKYCKLVKNLIVVFNYLEYYSLPIDKEEIWLNTLGQKAQ